MAKENCKTLNESLPTVSDGASDSTIIPFVQNLMQRHAIGMFKAQDLPRQVLPLLEYVEVTSPDIVIACDRGARPIGIAMLAAWRQTRNTRFPTIDNAIHFARISSSVDCSVMSERVGDICTRALRAQSHDRSGERSRIEHILFVDDWTVRGETAQISAELATDQGATSSFAVLSGTKADFSAYPHIPVPLGSILTSWRDNHQQLGVRYDNGETGLHSHLASPNRTQQSRSLRHAIHQGAQDL